MLAAGINTFGQLGVEARRYMMMTNFAEVFSFAAKAVAAGGGHSVVLKQDGSVWSTGRNTHGQLGDGSNTDRDSFVQVIPSHAKTVAAGAEHSLVTMRDGSVWATGFNVHGQLGDGSATNRQIFVQVMFDDAEAVAVAAGAEHSMVLKKDGSVWVTGENQYGQLGDGYPHIKHLKTSFVQVISSSTTAIAAGSRHSMVLKQDGSVWATGENEYGQLGDGSATLKSSFVQVVPSGCKSIAAGYDHSLVLKQDGSVWATGMNNFGQLGHGSKPSTSVFVQVIANGTQAVAAGDWHSMVLKDDESLWSTGANLYGQLGIGSMVSKKTFERVLLSIDGTWCTGISYLRLYGNICGS